jgi:hypothetical protein
MKTKFLWIEDNARTDLKYLLGPVYMSGKFDPVVAPTVAEGVYRMKQAEFAAVIVDIRLLPGNDDAWESLYLKLGGEKGSSRLGLCLLYSLFGPRIDDVEINGKPEWIKPERFGVLTVEDLGGNLGEALKSFGITVREQKTTHTLNTTLLKMVEQITGASTVAEEHRHA